MVRFGAIALLLIFFGLLTPSYSLMGADFSAQDLEREGNFVKGLKPVHGYWVNWTDTFFYRGNAATFNNFMGVYSKFQHVQQKVVLHSGTTQASSPWDKAPRNILADWSIYIWKTGHPLLPEETSGKDPLPAPPGKPAPTQVDVWVGPRLKLSELRIPADIEVTAFDKNLAPNSDIAKYLATRSRK
jgi:hypothetical protein